MRALVSYFVKKPLIVNVIMFGLIFAAISLWNRIGKEEMPNFTMNWLRVSIAYPGASAEDIEKFIINPIEEKLKGVFGFDEMSSTASFGSANFSMTFIPGVEVQEKIQEVKDAIESVEIPRDARDPVYRQYRSNERAIINISLYLKGIEILSTKDRQKLQEYALSFKNRLLSLPEVSGVETSGYLRPELQIQVDPEKLNQYEIPFHLLVDQIQSQNIRTPVGSLRDRRESEITLLSELDDVESMKSVLLSSGFEGQQFRLHQVADILNGFERTTTVQKIQGHESITFNVLKSVNTDILSAQKAIVSFIENLKKNDPDSPVGYVLVDDESYDIRNRLNLIGTNGFVGFVLILCILFFFLDLKSGLWVAMGIPFSMAFTLIGCLIIGETVNNMTLAGIIIVLGIVVDDAIIVAENIVRGRDPVKGTTDVLLPIIASVLTTIVAFIPLLFFSGRFGLLITVIPTIIAFMLIASLIESFFLLPAHMAHPYPLERFFKKIFPNPKFPLWREQLVASIENRYSYLLTKLIKFRFLMLLIFISILALASWVWRENMSYVMFPREEGHVFNVRVIAPSDTSRYEMAKLIRPIEDVFINDQRGLVSSVFSRIAQSRRGGEVRENEAQIRVEILPPSERKESLNQLTRDWEAKAALIPGFEEIRFLRQRFGSDSGSPIVLQVQENNDERREQVLELLFEKMSQLEMLTNVEIEKPVTRPEYRLNLKDQTTAMLNVPFSQMASTMRGFVQGHILYTISNGDEEIDIRIMSEDSQKRTIDDILNLRVANQSQYLVPLRQLVDVVPGERPSTIQRINYKRATNIYADLKPGTILTPLEIAAEIEAEIFPEILRGRPSTDLNWLGEVRDSRESQSDFSFALFLVLALIYVLLIFLFNSMTTPFLIGAIIPFGAAGVILAFTAHGMTQYGFFAVIGVLGMTGVIINDSIVMVDKLERTVNRSLQGLELIQDIATIASTRFRAVLVTTLTTVAGVLPTAYGLGGYDSMLAEMMLAMAWGLFFGMLITLVLVPVLYSFFFQIRGFFQSEVSS